MNPQQYENMSRQSDPSMIYMLINCDHVKETSIIEKLHSIKYVKEIQKISGNYDILIKLEAMTVDILKEIINWKIRQMDGIHSTTTLVCSHLSTKLTQR